MHDIWNPWHGCVRVSEGLSLIHIYRVRPYETRPGSADELYERWMAQTKSVLLHASRSSFYKLCQQTIDAFEALPLTNDRSKPVSYTHLQVRDLTGDARGPCRSGSAPARVDAPAGAPPRRRLPGALRPS